jgi:hypothetical protein
MVKRRPRHPHRKSTAHHEAGHAVIARVLTLASGPATIKPDYDEGIASFSITDVNSCDAEWEKRGKVRFLDAAWHACIIMSMAGAETEAVLLNRRATGDDATIGTGSR